MLTTGADRDSHDGYITHYMTTGDARIIGRGPREVTGLRKDGKEIALQLSVARTEFAGRVLFLGSIRDITMLKEREEMARQAQKKDC